jgi:thiamine biosynthesis lipoprotein
MRASARVLGVQLATASILTAAACSAPEGGTRYEYREAHMGTGVRIVIHAWDAEVARSAAAAAFAAVARVDSLLSDYRDDSEIARLAAEAGSGLLLEPSPELAQVVDSALVWADRTAGAFDVTVGPSTRLWRWAMRRDELPDSARLAAARALVGIRGLRVDSASGRVGLARAGMALDMGGIAKGLAASVALDTLRNRGIEVALVDAGGDLALGRAPPGRTGWRVEFPGGEVHELAEAAVATSGDRYQYLEVDGVRRSHIVDPRTGLGVVDAPTVAVVARGGVTADVLASALSVLSPEAGRALVEALGDVAVWWIPRTPETGVEWRTPGFPALPSPEVAVGGDPGPDEGG